MDVTCAVSKKKQNLNLTHRVDMIAQPVKDLILEDFPETQDSDYISFEELAKYRKKYLTKLIEGEKGEINELEQRVIDAMGENKILLNNIETESSMSPTFGDRMADNIASFGGSWSFIISFFMFIIVWISLNVFILASKAFDIYPFILLNLILSCIAAIQAPIIMMSQNRKEQKDRLRSENDYKINLKAELEIKLLHSKMDHLMMHQNKKLLEIQQLQLEYIDDAVKQKNSTNKS